MSSRIAELRIGDSHYPFILDHIKDELCPYKIAYGKIHDLEGPIIKKDDIGKSYNVCISVLGDPIFEERMLLKKYDRDVARKNIGLYYDSMYMFVIYPHDKISDQQEQLNHMQ